MTTPCRLQRACVHAARRVGGDGNGGSGVPTTSGVRLAHAGESSRVPEALSDLSFFVSNSVSPKLEQVDPQQTGFTSAAGCINGDEVIGMRSSGTDKCIVSLSVFLVCRWTFRLPFHSRLESILAVKLKLGLGFRVLREQHVPSSPWV